MFVRCRLASQGLSDRILNSQGTTIKDSFSSILLLRRLYLSLDMHFLGRVKRIWYLSPMRAAKVQASLRIRAVSPEPPLLAHTSSESKGTVRQKARSLAPLNDWACAVKICQDGMLEDTNSLDSAHFIIQRCNDYIFNQEIFGSASTYDVLHPLV